MPSDPIRPPIDLSVPPPSPELERGTPEYSTAYNELFRTTLKNNRVQIDALIEGDMPRVTLGITHDEDADSELLNRAVDQIGIRENWTVVPTGDQDGTFYHIGVADIGSTVLAVKQRPRVSTDNPDTLGGIEILRMDVYGGKVPEDLQGLWNAARKIPRPETSTQKRRLGRILGLPPDPDSQD